MAAIGILGYGEIGRAIAKFYRRVRVKDFNRDDGLKGVEVLHVCIPWSNKFIDIVVAELKVVEPKLTIIHSTMAPGATKKIIEGLPRAASWRGEIVHSPVRGMHPHLEKGLRTFVKYIGAEDKKSGEAAQRHLKSIGIRTKVFMPAAITELGKLFDTSYYGLCIAWHGEMKKMCDKLGVDFEKAVTDFNKTYNEGYTKLGAAHVVRPVLYAPQEGIGGHCIVPNAKILKTFFESRALDLVLQYEAQEDKHR